MEGIKATRGMALTGLVLGVITAAFTTTVTCSRKMMHTYRLHHITVGIGFTSGI